VSAKKGLGRGFDSLLPTDLLNEAFDPTAGVDEHISELRYILLSEISADPDQPRRVFDESALEELAQSISHHGVLQPLIVTPSQQGFIIVAGERRFRASKKAGLKKVPALVRTLSDQHKLELALIENIQRRDLNPLETATAYLKLRDQFNLKLDEISQRVGGKSIAAISNTLRLLSLPDAAKDALAQQKISEGHARQILALPDEIAQQALLEHIIKEGWSVRRAEQFVIGYKKADDRKKEIRATKATQTETPLTRSLAHKLATDVRVKTTAKGGQLVISFKDEKDLERITKTFL
jgi:ParB family transcriptional regulator, chromosome partitioning protein